MNRQEAESVGYTVDTTCYPWVAYKGPRFAPTELREVHTDKEGRLLRALTGVLSVMNVDDDGDYFICAEAEQTIANAGAVVEELG